MRGLPLLTVATRRSGRPHVDFRRIRILEVVSAIEKLSPIRFVHAALRPVPLTCPLKSIPRLSVSRSVPKPVS